MKRTPEEQAKWLSELPSHRLAFEDVDFLKRERLRPVRLQLELLKPELLQAEQGIVSTIVVFGSARTPSPEHVEENGAPHHGQNVYYDAARRFSGLVTEHCQARGIRKFVVTTGGGPGIMEAANRGAHEVGGKSIGLNIEIPFEQVPNPYVTPELCFNFHYFALRKMHFLMRAKALVVFPGGFGTLDELFDALTLIQTGKMPPMPIIMFGSEYWRRLLDIDFMAEQGVISAADKDLVTYVDTAEDAWQTIRDAYPDELGED